MKSKLTKSALAGAFLMAGMVLSLTLFTCSDGSGDGKTGGGSSTTYTIAKVSSFNPTKAHGDFTINPESAKAGDTITLTLDPDAGYILNKWTFTPKAIEAIEGTKKNTYTFEMPASNVTVSVTFKLGSNDGDDDSDDDDDDGDITYTVSKFATFNPATAHGDFTIDGEDSADVEEGAIVTLEPIPDEGYKFNTWTFSPTSVTATETPVDSGVYTFTMPGRAVTVRATFAVDNTPPTTITVAKMTTFNPATANGDFTINGAATVNVAPGTTITLVPTAAQGYEFSAWTFNPAALSATETPVGSGNWTFTTPTSGMNVLISATFTPSTGTPTFPVTKAAAFVPATAHGDFTITPASAEAGATITLVPTADNGYTFGNWIVVPATITVTAGTGGTYTFTMPTPGVPVTVSAAFIDSSTPTFTVSKAGTFVPATAHGDFTIDGVAGPVSVSAGATVTLVPQPVNGYKFGDWTFTPATITATAGTGGAYTFTMPTPGVEVTVSATFTEEAPPATNGTGTKTMTVKGGLGKAPAFPNASSGYQMHEGTRDITVTVTMAAGAITEIAYEDSIEWGPWTEYWLTQGQNAALHNAAAGLVAALNTAKNATAAYTPTTNFTGSAATAWGTYNTNIRKAVTDAVAAINAGKPNRTLTGGGANTPWLVNGAPLSGDATVVSSSFMGGNNQPVGATTNAPTDMTVKVTVAAGLITDITVTTDDSQCSFGLANLGGGVPNGSVGTRFPLWINRIKELNKTDEVDTVTGASTKAAPYRAISERCFKQAAHRAFMKIVNEY